MIENRGRMPRRRSDNHLSINKDGSANVELACGAVAVIDSEDLKLVSGYNWYKAKHGGYAVYRNGRVSIPMHRLVSGLPDGQLVDHKDRDPLNNRKSNLRVCTPSQNNANRLPKGGSISLFKGVSYDKSRSKWVAQLDHNCKHINLGRFDCEIEAAKAYDAKAKELHGEFAYLNFPDK